MRETIITRTPTPPTAPAAAPHEVIVVGAGHAGCEAALAAARMGRRTLLISGNLDTVALMPCNPSIGGPAKGNLVRELDALGGEMARNTDRTLIQIRELNTGKGPAVRALRAQSDKRRYARAMKQVLESQADLDLVQGLVAGLSWEPRPDRGEQRWRVGGVRLTTGAEFRAAAVVITTGTFLHGRIIIGDTVSEGGRAGENPATQLAEDLRRHGFDLGRLKTGTPPRVHARSIDYDLTEVQAGSAEPMFFSFDPPPASEWLEARPADVYPHVPPRAWRWQMPCYRISTTAATHDVIRANLHRAPMFNGTIESAGPRYCPSIEDKIVRFADKSSHSLFLEPEGFTTHEVYVQGANTSLPGDVQHEMLRQIPALREAELVRLGYAVEYDFVRPYQIRRTLESKLADGLFLAGQINGTTGYEEAAGQGLVAGISAARLARGQAGFELERAEAYLGVMIDDLVGSDLTEPYRLHTSRAEYRLLLRHDSADLRLTELGHRLGLASDSRLQRARERRSDLAAARAWLDALRIRPTAAVAARLAQAGQAPLRDTVPAAGLLRRPDMHVGLLAELAGVEPPAASARDELEYATKYAPYIRQQNAQVQQAQAMESQPVPSGTDFASLHGMRTEARLRLERFRPATVGQAARLEGVTPSDVAVLLIHLKRERARVPGVNGTQSAAETPAARGNGRRPTARARTVRPGRAKTRMRRP